jgi:hypothetical protein
VFKAILLMVAFLFVSIQASGTNSQENNPYWQVVSHDWPLLTARVECKVGGYEVTFMNVYDRPIRFSYAVVDGSNESPLYSQVTVGGRGGYKQVWKPSNISCNRVVWIVIKQVEFK